jgi:tryptophan-rich sensory protein
MITPLAPPFPPPLDPSIDDPPAARGGHKAIPSKETRAGWLGSALGLAAFAGASFATAAVGARITIRNKGWYRLLRKSSLNPPDRTFSKVWPVLYALGAASAWRVARTPDSPERTRALRLWSTQLACNAAWTPFFFGAHRPALAMGDLVANGASLAAYALEARKVDRFAALLVTPYLAWLGFAGTLNASILAKNTGLRARLFRG